MFPGRKMKDYDHNADDYTYKIKVLTLMIAAEESEQYGGYGAHLQHRAGAVNPINLGAGALKVLLEYYQNLQKECVEA